jgi:hypothetical protein
LEWKTKSFYHFKLIFICQIIFGKILNLFNHVDLHKRNWESLSDQLFWILLFEEVREVEGSWRKLKKDWEIYIIKKKDVLTIQRGECNGSGSDWHLKELFLVHYLEQKTSCFSVQNSKELYEIETQIHRIESHARRFNFFLFLQFFFNSISILSIPKKKNYDWNNRTYILFFSWITNRATINKKFTSKKTSVYNWFVPISLKMHFFQNLPKKSTFKFKTIVFNRIFLINCHEWGVQIIFTIFKIFIFGFF